MLHRAGAGVGQLAGAAALCLLLAGTVLAGETITVRPGAKETIETPPRTILTAVFQVTNELAQRREFLAEVKLPAGWAPVAREVPFELGGNETDLRLVSFFVPQGAPVGAYSVTYSVKDTQVPARTGSATIRVVVLAFNRLQAKLLDAPAYVIAGESCSIAFLVANQSNQEHALAIKPFSSNGLPIVADATGFTLGVGESRTVKFTVRTSDALRYVLTDHIQLTVVAQRDAAISASASALINVIPRITGSEDIYHRIPAQLTLRFAGQDGLVSGSEFQAEFAGRGTLDEDGQHNIDFLFRTPDTQFDVPSYGSRDEYRLSVWSWNYEVRLGDQPYSLSELTQNGYYGRGAEVNFLRGDFVFGGYHVDSLWLEPSEEASAAHVDYLFGQGNVLRLNLFEKTSDVGRDGVLSLETRLKPSRQTELGLEYAFGRKDEATGEGRDDAYLLTFSGLHQFLSYSFKFVRANPDYAGFYRDTQFYSGSVTIPVTNRLRFDVNLSEQETNLDRDPARGMASLTRNREVGFSYRLPTETTLQISRRSQTLQDQMPAPTVDMEEDAWRVALSQSFRSCTLFTSVDFGENRDHILGKSADFRRYLLTASFMPTTGQSHSIFAELDTGSEMSVEKSHRFNAGFNSSFHITPRTTFSLSYQTNHAREMELGDQTVFEATLTHTLLNRNQITLRGRRTVYRDPAVPTEDAFLVEYMIPFGLPVSRLKSVGQVGGRLYDEETNRPVANAILRIEGAAAVTDSGGEFVFPALKPGNYLVSVDTTSVKGNLIPAQKMPAEVSVAGGKSTSLDIAMTKGATVSGHVILYTLGQTRFLGEEAKLVEVSGRPDVLLEITNGTEVKRRVTDSQGGFEFEALVPGKWTLTADSSELPQYHYYEKDTFEFELKPGDSKEVLIKILPKRRPVRIIEEGGVIKEETKK